MSTPSFEAKRLNSRSSSEFEQGEAALRAIPHQLLQSLSRRISENYQSLPNRLVWRAERGESTGYPPIRHSQQVRTGRQDQSLITYSCKPYC